MRQVPEKSAQKAVTIIGSGKMALHWSYYLSTLHIPFFSWNRKNHTPAELHSFAQNSSIFFVLIKDDQINLFIEKFSFLKEKILIHASGALNTNLALSMHPLMTFSETLYPAEFYPQIPLVIDQGLAPFENFLPEIKNPTLVLSPEKKALYHALCVMSGNFTQALWKWTSELFFQECAIPKEYLIPYLQKNYENVLKNLEKPKSTTKNSAWILTGPMARADIQTLLKNYQALPNLELKNLYASFASNFNPEWKGLFQ